MIDQFEELPEEDELGVTEVVPGPANLAIVAAATVACGAAGAALIAFVLG
jgi:hypothetical protein